MKSLPILYSLTSKGKTQTWEIEVKGDMFRAITGQLDGKKIVNEWTTCLPKNVGKKNETSPAEQAESEAQSAWQKKLDAGYYEDVKDIYKPKFIEPMTAATYGKVKFEFPVWSQPKLDGMRAIVNKKQMQSRYGKVIPSCPHILEGLKKLHEKHPFLVFDGELYADQLSDNFDELMSIVRQQKPTEEDLRKSRENIQFWIYDIVDTEMRYVDRMELIEDLFEDFQLAMTADVVSGFRWFVRVLTNVATNQHELDELNGEYIAAGKEGQIIRLDKCYENKRSKSLIKRKEFFEDEFEIKDVGEGIGNKAGMAGQFFLINKDGTIFKSNIRGNRAFLRKCLAEKDDLIGRWATVRYPNLTPSGVPRFPYVVKLRDDMDLPPEKRKKNK